LTANTYYFPIAGGGNRSTTETDVDAEAPSAATVSNFYANVSTALGAGNSAVFTYRDNAVGTSVTCTISGASATTCNDSTHSFAAAKGDLLTIQVVTTGTIVATPTLVMTTQFGTTGSNGTVNTGTAHQTALYSAAGTAVSGAGPGTSGQVWTSNGAGADPTFQAAAGGALVQLCSLTASASTELDFKTANCPNGTIATSSYHEFVIRGRSITFSTGEILFIEVSTDGGTTYDTTSGHYGTQELFSFATTTGSATGGTSTHIPLRDANTTLVANSAVSFDWSLSDPASTTIFKMFQGRTVYDDNSVGLLIFNQGAAYLQTTAITAFRVINNTGTWSGVVTLYGVTP
jgi:hypothetical protein